MPLFTSSYQCLSLSLRILRKIGLVSDVYPSGDSKTQRNLPFRDWNSRIQQNRSTLYSSLNYSPRGKLAELEINLLKCWERVPFSFLSHSQGDFNERPICSQNFSIRKCFREMISWKHFQTLITVMKLFLMIKKLLQFKENTFQEFKFRAKAAMSEHNL